ncbi:hypothetical protein ETAA8_08260 [Anatilimnocola aggregata]|uniref:Cytochrome c domain-containing protein n=1 Tax=Anatilimnocola aggregata TaxID=2528021 RepID=A0A517Y6A0_9BACT|nr:hypothetical protein [Anatilimnocola aggregata]QDU25755.1 hypothetical protein ETAA8_08260 [Anatilimnocola aggregata]
MRVHLGRVAVSLFAFVLLGAGISSAQPPGNRFGPPPEPKPLSPEQKEQIEAWRKQFPYVSLADRLQYENSHRADSAPKPEPTSKEPSAKDKPAELSLRAKSLAMLHSDQLERFIANQGLGFRRMIAPAPEHLTVKPYQPIPFENVPPLAAEEAALTPTPFLHEDRNLTGDVDLAMLKLMPTRNEVARFHQGSEYWFLPVWGFGHVKSRDQVAGFIPHSFIEPPRMSVDTWRLPKFAGPDAVPPQDPNRWKIARLELVSLLKQEEPRVYESKNLPRMEDLKDAPTRPLTKVESASLAKLRAGEALPTSSTTNRIEFLGPIRASKQCLQCHEVPEGTLLGAFSYELRRHPSLPDKPATETPE